MDFASCWSHCMACAHIRQCRDARTSNRLPAGPRRPGLSWPYWRWQGGDCQPRDGKVQNKVAPPAQGATQFSGLEFAHAECNRRLRLPPLFSGRRKCFKHNRPASLPCGEAGLGRYPRPSPAEGDMQHHHLGSPHCKCWLPTRTNKNHSRSGDGEPKKQARTFSARAGPIRQRHLLPAELEPLYPAQPHMPWTRTRKTR
jgi:hypothetical protein